MSSNDDHKSSANTPEEETSVDSAFKNLEKPIERTTPHGGATLPVTPARTPDSGSVTRPSVNREFGPDKSPTEHSKETFRSDSVRDLWHPPEHQSARARLQSSETRAGWLSRLTFHWASGLLWVGLKP